MNPDCFLFCFFDPRSSSFLKYLKKGELKYPKDSSISSMTPECGQSSPVVGDFEENYYASKIPSCEVL